MFGELLVTSDSALAALSTEITSNLLASSATATGGAGTITITEGLVTKTMAQTRGGSTATFKKKKILSGPKIISVTFSEPVPGNSDVAIIGTQKDVVLSPSDITASNGIIHTVNTVFLPPTIASLAAYAASSASVPGASVSQGQAQNGQAQQQAQPAPLSKFVAALQACGML